MTIRQDRAHRPARDAREKYQTWRDAAQSAAVLTQRTGVQHRPVINQDGSLAVVAGE